MTSLPRSNPSGHGELHPVRAGDHHRYAMWDAAYVLGSLSAADRREFEAHLAHCLKCREAVTEISGMPALLARLDRHEVAAITAADPVAEVPQVSTELLPALLATVRWRRRRTRLLSWAGSAVAAAAVSVAVFVGVAGQSPPEATVSAMPMTQVGTTALASTVSVSSERWGSLIDLNCVCLAPVNAHHDTLAMVVVGRDGSHTRLATWVAEPGHTATPAASISTSTDQIASVQVISADDGKVLLERSL